MGRQDLFPIAFAAIGLLGAGLLAAPWGVRLAQSFTMGLPGDGPPRAAEYFSLDRLGPDLDLRLVGVLSALALFGLIVAISERRLGIILLGIWGAVLLLFANPRWLPVPGAGALDLVTVTTSLFVPGALAVALAVEVGYRWLRARARLLSLVALGAIGLGASAWGTAQLMALLNASDRLADPADVEASAWIRSSVPEGSVFAVNAAIRQWDPEFVVPTDGGQWLPLLAGRRTTLLPLLYPAERGTSVAEVRRMEQIARALASDAGNPETVALLKAAGVTYVYLGARGGPIDERSLATSAAYRKVYGKGGVSIYEVPGTSGDRR